MEKPTSGPFSWPGLGYARFNDVTVQLTSVVMKMDIEGAEFLAPEKQRSIAIQTLKFAPNDQFMAAGMD